MGRGRGNARRERGGGQLSADGISDPPERTNAYLHLDGDSTSSDLYRACPRNLAGCGTILREKEPLSIRGLNCEYVASSNPMSAALFLSIFTGPVPETPPTELPPDLYKCGGSGWRERGGG